MDIGRGADVVRSILSQLSAATAARDADSIMALFDDDAVLLGTTGQAIGADDRAAYINGVVTQPGQLSWEWREVIVNHSHESLIVFAAFGDIVLSHPADEDRRAMRLSGALRADADGRWRFLQFHGSIPAVDAP